MLPSQGRHLAVWALLLALACASHNDTAYQERNCFRGKPLDLGLGECWVWLRYMQEVVNLCVRELGYVRSRKQAAFVASRSCVLVLLHRLS